jgi:hypothetical protein
MSVQLLVNQNHLRNKLIGPFKIIDKYNDVNYRIVCVENNKVQDVHYNRLRPYRSRVSLSQPSTVCQQVIVNKDKSHFSFSNHFESLAL